MTHVSIGPSNNLQKKHGQFCTPPEEKRDPLHDPHFGRQVLARLLEHLRLLILKVHGLINKSTNERVIIEGGQELLG